jgi:hypothetical protein
MPKELLDEGCTGGIATYGVLVKPDKGFGHVGSGEEGML